MEGKNKFGFSAKPSIGQGAGILVLHAWWGLNNFFKDFCTRLADEGFVVFAPDLYHGKVATTIDEAKLLRSKLSSKQVEFELLSGLNHLRSTPGVSKNPLGLIGFSLGARWACWLSLEKPDEVGAVTIFYGSKIMDYSNSNAAYLGHFAENDEWQSISGVRKLEKCLNIANRPVTFYVYKGTGHWFFEKDRLDAYNPNAAELAWNRTVEFLKTQLK